MRANFKNFLMLSMIFNMLVGCNNLQFKDQGEFRFLQGNGDGSYKTVSIIVIILVVLDIIIVFSFCCSKYINADDTCWVICVVLFIPFPRSCFVYCIKKKLNSIKQNKDIHLQDNMNIIKQSELDLKKKSNFANLNKYKSINTEFEKSVERNLKEEDEKTKIRREKIAVMSEFDKIELLKRTAHLEDTNGGRCENYTWVQNQDEKFEMFVVIPSDTNESQIKVGWNSKNLKIVVNNEKLVDGELYAPIMEYTFMWILDRVKGNKIIYITFDKINKNQRWDYVIKGEDPLTQQKLNLKPLDLYGYLRPETEKGLTEYKETQGNN